MPRWPRLYLPRQSEDWWPEHWYGVPDLCPPIGKFGNPAKVGDRVAYNARPPVTMIVSACGRDWVICTRKHQYADRLEHTDPRDYRNRPGP